MPVIDHVEACILVDGIPLQEYPAVEADKPTEESNITYVEAIPGKRFTVSITWLPGFQLKRANTLVSKIDLDGLRRYCRRVNGDTLPRDRVLSREIVHNYSSGWIPGQEGLREVAYFTIGVLELSMCILPGIFWIPDSLTGNSRFGGFGKQYSYSRRN